MSLLHANTYGPAEITRARCLYLKDLLEPWSIRRLAARTGLTKSAVESLYAGTRDLSMADVELIAPVLRMAPVDLFTELLAVEPTSPETKNGSGVEPGAVALPGLDSNQEPIGFKRDNVIEADFGRPLRAVAPAPIVHISAAR